MLLSKETDYAIRIVSCLSKSDRHLSAAEISAKTGVTKNFALKILHSLLNNGIVSGIKGKNGGYLLCKNPNDITLLEIIQIFDETSFVNHCTHRNSCNNPGGCCEFKWVFDNASQCLKEIFGKVTFDNENNI